MSEGVRAPNGKVKEKSALAILAVVVVVIVVLSVISVWALHGSRSAPLSEIDGGVKYKVDDLPGGFYRPWDYVSVSIYSGEPHSDGNYVIYPVYVFWNLSSSEFTGLNLGDFGDRNISGAWFNLMVYDRAGDGEVSDGDYIAVTSSNGSLDSNTDYFLQFTTRSMLHSGIAPFYTILGFRYSVSGFISWVEAEPNEIAL